MESNVDRQPRGPRVGGKSTMWLLRTLVAASSIVFVSVACDEDFVGPQVAGTYAGTLTLAATSTAEGGTVTIEFPIDAELTVSQSDAEVTIAGTLEILGETGSLSTLTGTINASGVFTETGIGLADAWWEDDLEPECGAVTSTSSSISFSGEDLQMRASIEARSCSQKVSGTLTRR